MAAGQVPVVRPCPKCQWLTGWLDFCNPPCQVLLSTSLPPTPLQYFPSFFSSFAQKQRDICHQFSSPQNHTAPLPAWKNCRVVNVSTSLCSCALSERLICRYHCHCRLFLSIQFRHRFLASWITAASDHVYLHAVKTSASWHQPAMKCTTTGLAAFRWSPSPQPFSFNLFSTLFFHYFFLYFFSPPPLCF